MNAKELLPLCDQLVADAKCLQIAVERGDHEAALEAWNAIWRLVAGTLTPTLFIPEKTEE
jgi:hypothetical protein